MTRGRMRKGNGGVEDKGIRRLREEARRLREEAKKKLEKARIIESEGYETFMFYLSASLKSRIQAKAKEKGETMTSVVIAALEEYLGKEEGK